MSTPMPPNLPPNLPPEGQQPPYPYGPYPYPYYPPPGGMFAPPPTPPKRGLQWWHWLFIAGGGILAVTCVLCSSLYTLGRIVASNAPTPSYSAPTPVAFPSPKASPTTQTQTRPQTVATGTLTFSGSDYIAGGKSYAYSTSKGDVLTISASSMGSAVHIGVTGYNGDWWTLDFGAPGTVAPINGKPAVLVPGTYSDAHRYPFNGNGPGLDLSGNGRGCNTLTGSFTIIDAVFSPQGAVQKFDATFVQYCEGGTSATSGQVHIANPPAD